MHLNLGHIVAAKPDGRPSPVTTVFDRADPSKIAEVRISCRGVLDGQKKKHHIVLRMEPMLLKNYEIVNGPIKAGDVLYISDKGCDPCIARDQWRGEYVYFLITTDTLSRAPSAQEAAASRNTSASNNTSETQTA